MQARFEQPRRGLFVVYYDHDEQLTPQAQRELLEAIAAASGPVAIIFRLGRGLTTVSRAVPDYWLDVTTRRDCPIVAIAIVSHSLAVRVAASAFGISSTLRRVRLTVQSFVDAEGAFHWASAQLAEQKVNVGT